jgi:hypothetical protein
MQWNPSSAIVTAQVCQRQALGESQEYLQVSMRTFGCGGPVVVHQEDERIQFSRSHQHFHLMEIELDSLDHCQACRRVHGEDETEIRIFSLAPYLCGSAASWVLAGHKVVITNGEQDHSSCLVVCDFLFAMLTSRPELFPVKASIS